MPKYTELFTPHHIATLADWLKEKGEVFVQIELPHSGGSGNYSTARSLGELKRAVQQVNNSEIEITIWKNRTQAEFESDHPFPDDLTWIYAHPEEVMYFSVRKNRNSSASYIQDPAKYKKDVDEWFG
jgi:hypothetical protein